MKTLDTLSEEEGKLEAIEKIDYVLERVGEIENIESEQGQEELKKALEQLQRIGADKASQDDEGGVKQGGWRGLITKLPWADLDKDQEKHIKKEIFGLGKDTESLA